MLLELATSMAPHVPQSDRIILSETGRFGEGGLDRAAH